MNKPQQQGAAAPPVEPLADPVIDPLIARYLEHVHTGRRLAARTCALYAFHLGELQRFAATAQVPLLQLHEAHVRRFVAQMHGAGRQGRSIALVLSCWRGFYQWLGVMGQVANNPVQGVRAPRAPKLLPKALGVDDAVQLAAYRGDGAGRAGAKPHADPPWMQARDAAMTELLYGCGLRVSELAGLDTRPHADTERLGRGWLDLDAAEAHVFGKGSKRRSVPMGAPTCLAVQQWLAQRAGLGAVVQGQSALFVGQRGSRLTPQAIWQRLRLRSMQAGLSTPVHPHMLRHSFASHVLQSSGDLRAVQELLGHASIGTTQVYTRLDHQHLAAVYDAAHPRAKITKNGKPDSSS